jgi:hypothetical protein
MADENVNVNVEFTGFKSQLKDAQRDLEIVIQKYGESSEAAKDAAKSVALIKDQIEDSRDAVKAFTGAGKFDAVTKSLSAVSGGFTAVQGAIGLVSKDNKALEQTMLKVQSAMALTQGLTALEDAGRSFKQLGQVAGDALKGIRTGIAATGIGLLVVALGLIVAYWDDIKEAVSGVSAEQEALNKETEANAKASQENLDALTSSEQQLKLAGKSEKEIYDLKIKQYDTTIADAEAKLASDKATLDAQVAAAQRNKDILKGVLDFISLPLTLVLDTIDQIGLAFGKDFGLREGFKESVANMIFDPAEVKAEGEKAIKESEQALNKIKEQRAGIINAQNDKDKADAEAKKKKREEDNKKELDEEEKKQKELAKIAADAAFEASKLGKTELEKQKLDINEKYRERLEKVKKGSQAEIDLNKLRDAEIAKAEEEARKKAEDKKKQDNDKALSDEEKALEERFNLLQTSAVKEIEKQEDLDKALLDLEVKKLEEQIALQKKYGQDTTALELQLAEKNKEIGDKAEEDEKARQERIKEARQAQIAGAIETATAIFDAANAVQEAQKQREIEDLKAKGLSQEEAAKQTDEINKKYFEKNKGVQIGQAIIQTLQSSISAFSSLAAIPVVGPALGAVAAAAALVTGYATVDKIRNTSYASSAGASAPPSGSSGSKFAEGGMLQGPSHSMGGIKTAMGELEGGEFVINKRSTANFLPLIQAINDQGNSNSNAGPSQAETPIIKTYVVSSEVSSQQEANKRVSDIARL